MMGMTASGLALSVVLGMALGAGTYTCYYAEGFSYLSNDPRACINCHIMRDHYDGWSKASHHAVATCNDCHAPHDFLAKYWTKAENGFWHSKAFTLQDFHDPLVIRPKNARVLQNSCVYCHTEMVSNILEHDALEDGGAGYCVRCHSSVGHGPAK